MKEKSAERGVQGTERVTHVHVADEAAGGYGRETWKVEFAAHGSGCWELGCADVEGWENAVVAVEAPLCPELWFWRW